MYRFHLLSRSFKDFDVDVQNVECSDGPSIEELMKYIAQLELIQERNQVGLVISPFAWICVGFPNNISMNISCKAKIVKKSYKSGIMSYVSLICKCYFETNFSKQIFSIGSMLTILFLYRIYPQQKKIAEQEKELRILKKNQRISDLKLKTCNKKLKKVRQQLQQEKLNKSKVIEYLRTIFNAEQLLFFNMQIRNAGKMSRGRRYTSEKKV